MIYIVGNWKSNKTLAEAKTWIEAVKGKLPQLPSVTPVVVPSFFHLLLFQESFPNLALGVQTLSPFPQGAYTGAVAAAQIKDIVSYAIVGHSERREYFKETDSVIARQVILSLENGITPIIGVHKDNYYSQLSQLEKPDLERSLVMYEPPEAIGSGEPAEPNEVDKMASHIKETFPIKALLYGGSVTSRNITSFLTLEPIDGVVVGSASLNPEEWIEMVKAAALLAASKE